MLEFLVRLTAIRVLRHRYRESTKDANHRRRIEQALRLGGSARHWVPGKTRPGVRRTERENRMRMARDRSSPEPWRQAERLEAGPTGVGSPGYVVQQAGPLSPVQVERPVFELVEAREYGLQAPRERVLQKPQSERWSVGVR